MKKKLEGELISIAHRILKLKGKEDVIALQKEAKEVFEKLSVLVFFEEQFKDSVPNYADSSFFNTLENVYNHEKVEKDAEAEFIRHELVAESPEEDEELVEPLMETIKDMVAEMPAKEETIDDLLAEVLPEPTFIKKEEAEALEAKANKNLSLNDRLSKGITIGLNDKLAFTKHLFNGNQEDYNRVISQLNTINSESDAKTFLETMIKPDYNNWDGKEEYETRFLEIIERKFIS